MRRLLLSTATALCLVALAGLGLARGSELQGGSASGPKVLPVTPVKVVPVVTPVKVVPVKKEKESGCGSHGTRIDFVDTPRDAAKIAKKEGKLVFVLHVSGHFEDPRFT
jgi:hypothetical protein